MFVGIRSNSVVLGTCLYAIGPLNYLGRDELGLAGTVILRFLMQSV